ncbi:MAG TPA: DnaJ domain-containing protein [Phycisphaerales bacterium]|nr:DnaJ domain-containing protein [Phycisphaerales bacterium]
MTRRRAENHYHTLGVDRNATEQQIRAAYRALAKAHHPDTAPAMRKPSRDADDKRFAEVARAYEVLSDPALRREHDAELDRREHAHTPAGQAHYTWENVAAARPRERPSKDPLAEFDDLYETFYSDRTIE